MIQNKNNVSVAILCGGNSSRFGENKMLFEIEGEPLFKIVYDRFESLSDDVFLQGLCEKVITDFPCYQDKTKTKSPLDGIYSALINAEYGRVFVVAADMPNIDPLIFKKEKKYVRFDAVIPRWRSGYYEPLAAIYSEELIPFIKSMLDKRSYKVTQLYDHIDKIKNIDIDELIRNEEIDSNCFMNINKKEDLVEMERQVCI